MEFDRLLQYSYLIKIFSKNIMLKIMNVRTHTNLKKDRGERILRLVSQAQER